MVKVAIQKTFVASDGTEFKTRKEADDYESSGFLKQFVGWKAERVEAADKRDTEKGKKDALAIEAWALRLRGKRLESGEVKRKVKTKAEREAEKAAANEAKLKADAEAAAKAAEASGAAAEAPQAPGEAHHGHHQAA